MAKAKSKSFTGRRREKRTKLSVRFADLASTKLITIGGVGTIVAVSLVVVLLLAYSAPLFFPASLGPAKQAALPWAEPTAAGRPLHVAVDEYRTMGWALFGDGTLQVFRLDTGAEIRRERLFGDDAEVTAVSVISDSSDEAERENELSLSVAVGFSNGRIQLGTIGYRTSFESASTLPVELRHLGVGETEEFRGGIVKVTPQRQHRLQRVVREFLPPVAMSDSPIRLLGHARKGKSFAMATFNGDGELQLASTRLTVNPFTEEAEFKIRSKKLLEFPAHGAAEPKFIELPARGDGVYLAWEDGHLLRFEAASIRSAKLAETIEMLDGSDAVATVFDFALNRETLLCGDSSGGLRGWFLVNRENSVGLNGIPKSSDGWLLTPVHTLPSRSVAISSLGISERTRLIAAGYADGHVRLCDVTSEQVVIDADTGRDEEIELALLTPKDDGVIAMSASGLWMRDFDPAHPEATLSSLFLPMWYEGYTRREPVWQSSFAGVGPEMKLGLRPLVFGTLKATFYSMIFAAPLALLAAIFTSEFLEPKAKAAIKPVIEMMASLPSVVLGFLAALVFAPVVEQFVPVTLSLFVTLPAVVLLGAFLWQLLPQHVAVAHQKQRFKLITVLVLPLGLLLAWWSGPAVESLLFAGDVILWLDGQIGTGTGAWMILVLPLTAMGMTFLVNLTFNSWLRRASQGWARRTFSLVNLLKYVAALVLTLLAAWGVSALLTTIGFDPRGSYVDTYVQRNALVVGFVMGFAIIPIIYTIAEDALSTVPQHLRSASLGAGATPWQTAIRIVVPTAMSGLFSALMIGLGRAVGETMIVLMAGGNTPVRDWNIFNGFSTLAARIAVELPEAVEGSTHFRTLFLAALMLFLMTFMINTVAELVRLRFRKRAVEL